MKIAEKSYRVINYGVDLVFILILVSFFNLAPGNAFFGVSFIAIYFLYYLVFEFTMQKTLGKMLTKTIVVDLNGEKPKLKNILIRSICRLFHVDMLSFLTGTYGIHDGYSKTRIVKRKH